MGLLQNGYRHNLIGRIVGATNIDGWRPEVGVYQGHRPSANRNSLSELTDNLSAIPNGNRHPATWVMPNKAGGLSSRKATMTYAVTGAMLSGYPIDGTSSLTITTNTPAGELIVSGDGTATLTITSNTPLLTASINGTGSSTITVSTNTPLLGAIADLIASGTLTVSGGLTAYAVGFMEGTTEEAGLTNAGIANSVWGKVIEAGYSADEMLRILTAFAAGSATGLEGVNPQFTGIDGTTLRIDGNYSAGTRTIDALNGA